MTTFEPTAVQREQVKLMAAMGVLTHVQISKLIINPRTGKGITKMTLHRYFREELDDGMPSADHAVVQSIFKKAIGNGPQAVTAAIWWTKNRLGWTNNERIEHRSPDGQSNYGVLVVPGPISPTDWVNKQVAKNAKKTAPASQGAA